MSAPYRKAFTESLPGATQVADPFDVIKHANSNVDACRRRVKNDTLGHRGHKDDPLFQSRRLRAKAHERLDEKGNEKLLGLLEAGDPNGEAATCGWVTWFNTERIHGELDDLTPAEVEHAYYAAESEANAA